MFCPSCAGLRRLFARLEDDAEQPAESAATAQSTAAPRSDGYQFAAEESEVGEREGLAVELEGRDFALFRVQGEVVAIDGACPHEGAPLAQGAIDNGVVTCPWHGWTFNACTGCSLAPGGNDVRRYPTLVEDGRVYIQTGAYIQTGSFIQERTAPTPAAGTPSQLSRAQSAALRVLEVIQETPDTKTYRLDNSAGEISLHRPGQFVQVTVPIDGQTHSRSFTISSSPTRPEILEVTVKRNPSGAVSNYLHDNISADDALRVHGPNGAFFFDRERHREPLALISAGSGVTPMMSILRYLADNDLTLPCAFIHGARTPADVIFADECVALARRLGNLQYSVHLSQPPVGWEGPAGRIDFDAISSLIDDVRLYRYFLCGPGAFMDHVRQALLEAGAPAERIHTEEFHSPGLARPGNASWQLTPRDQ